MRSDMLGVQVADLSAPLQEGKALGALHGCWPGNENNACDTPTCCII